MRFEVLAHDLVSTPQTSWRTSGRQIITRRKVGSDLGSPGQLNAFTHMHDVSPLPPQRQHPSPTYIIEKYDLKESWDKKCAPPKENNCLLLPPQTTGEKQKKLPSKGVEEMRPPNIVDNSFSTTQTRGGNNYTTQNCETTKTIVLPLQIVGTEFWHCGQIV